MIRLDTQAYWKKHSTASSMVTMDVQDKFGNEIQHEIWWIETTKTTVWMDYDASTAGQCCRFERTSFLNSKPIFMRFVEQRTCMCDTCGKAFAAADELEDNYLVPDGKKPLLSMYFRLLNGRKSGGFSFALLHLNSDRDFEIPTSLDAALTWNPPVSCTDEELQGYDNECTAFSFVVLSIASVAAQIDTGSTIDTIEKKTDALAKAIIGVPEWRGFPKMTARGKDNQETSTSIHAQKKIIDYLTAFEDHGPQGVPMNRRQFSSTDVSVSPYVMVKRTVQQDLVNNPPPFEKFGKKSAQAMHYYAEAHGILLSAARSKQKDYDETYPAVADDNNNNNDNNVPANTCTMGSCHGQCSTSMDNVIHDVHRRANEYPALHNHVECTKDTTILNSDVVFETCLTLCFSLLGTYVTNNLGLQYTTVLSLFVPSINQITDELQFFQVLLTPDGRLVGMSTTGLEDEVLFTYFGHFREHAPSRLTSWFVNRYELDQNIVYRATINVAGPTHVFGPSQSMLDVQIEKGGTFKLVPDHHFVFNLYEYDLGLRKQELPTENINTVGSLAYDTTKRFEDLKSSAGLVHIKHVSETDYQQEKFEQEEQEICSPYNILHKKVIVIWDFKRNIPLMVKYKQTKGDYYNIPTAAFFGMVLVYCGEKMDEDGHVVTENNQPVMESKAFNMAFTSPSHEKSAAWVVAAMELAWGLVPSRMSATCAPPTAAELGNEEFMARSQVMGCGPEFAEGVAILRNARLISFWGDNGVPFHSGVLLSVMIAGKWN